MIRAKVYAIVEGYSSLPAQPVVLLERLTHGSVTRVKQPFASHIYWTTLVEVRSNQEQVLPYFTFVDFSATRTKAFLKTFYF